MDLGRKHDECIHISEKKETLPHEDIILLEELYRGSKIAFEKLYGRFWHRLYLAAYNVLRDKEVCEDIIQEIFSQLWIRRSNLAIKNLESYLFTAVRFQVFKCINNKKCRNNFVIELSKLPAEFFDTQQSYREIEEALKISIEKLPEKCGKIFYLSRQEHLTNKEIAARLNISTKTVENQITLAIKKMRKYLSPWTLPILLLTILDILR
ncbi:RNA polymerase sigma-70 factor [Sphingobacterium sp. HMA12]|uniref:RNA polymerase sigma-70 factor n=1 Tax=Sphingobacterium sp. HMA12 TaxID=2050894 RepID=UPI000CE9DA11|nr:RNA polymerase sigma-70 factor [Sphingobacterium sp. HMA12]